MVVIPYWKRSQRNCGEIRSIIAVQAIQKDAWQRHIDKMKKNHKMYIDVLGPF